MKTGIYCLLNENGKRYIGSSVNISYRTSRHLLGLKKGKHCNLHLQAAYNLGQKFSIEVLELCEETELVAREQFYIDQYRTMEKEFGYNLTVAGRTYPSEEGKRRIGDSKRGKTLEQIHGTKKAAQIRKKMRANSGGKNNPRYGVKGELHPFFGKKMKEVVGDEVAAKMAQATSTTMKGVAKSKATRRKLSKAHKGKKLSAEHKEAIGKGGRETYLKVGPRTFDEKYGSRAEEIKTRIAASVSKSTKGSKKSQAWVEKMKSRRCPITGRLLPKEKLNAK